MRMMVSSHVRCRYDAEKNNHAIPESWALLSSWIAFAWLGHFYTHIGDRVLHSLHLTEESGGQDVKQVATSSDSCLYRPGDNVKIPSPYHSLLQGATASIFLLVLFMYISARNVWW